MTDLYKKSIPLDPNLPYSQNLANAINEYWRMQVAVPDGTRSVNEGSAYTLNSVNGIPKQIVNNPRITHPAIIRVRRGPRNRWFITDGDDK